MKVSDYKNLKSFLDDLICLNDFKKDYEKQISAGEKYTHRLDQCDLFFKTKREAISFYRDMKNN